MAQQVGRGRPQQQESACRLPLAPTLVNQAAQGLEQLRHALDLVQDLAPRCAPPCPERCGRCGGEHGPEQCPERERDPRLAAYPYLGDDYAFTEREKLYTLFEELTGARFTTSYARIGGVARDVPEGWTQRVDAFCDQFLPILEEILALLTRNKIFMDRTVGVGVISREDAIAYGLTGPNLRGSGVPLDLRKDQPYSGYEQYEFDVPVGTTGDSYDRYLVRGEEMRQSVRIIRQVIARFPEGPWYATDARRIFAPPKDKVLTSMEELIQNFMIVTAGPQVPAGEVYFEAENPKGILGFYVVSKGGGVPYRLKIRSPSFCNLSIVPKACVGCLISDVVAILGSLDFVMGECDR